MATGTVVDLVIQQSPVAEVTDNVVAICSFLAKPAQCIVACPQWSAFLPACAEALFNAYSKCYLDALPPEVVGIMVPIVATNTREAFHEAWLQAEASAASLCVDALAGVARWARVVFHGMLPFLEKTVHLPATAIPFGVVAVFAHVARARHFVATMAVNGQGELTGHTVCGSSGLRFLVH